MSMYNVKSNSNGYHIHKLDDDLNPEAHYDVSTKDCTCQAGIRATCRHRQMLPLFTASGRVDTGWFIKWTKDGFDGWFFLDQAHGLVSEKRVKGWWRRA